MKVLKNWRNHRGGLKRVWTLSLCWRRLDSSMLREGRPSKLSNSLILATELNRKRQLCVFLVPPTLLPPPQAQQRKDQSKSWIHLGPSKIPSAGDRCKAATLVVRRDACYCPLQTGDVK
ncbi:hypothetical protein FRC03_009908 [Tulasnella sp. 419]|nr:hypothetical protein FRC02_009941 [Tulasnella sp. 418]KAG8957688.1 hypothetical protein FRC03_009908 [Tulasnella sp. 419]